MLYNALQEVDGDFNDSIFINSVVAKKKDTGPPLTPNPAKFAFLACLRSVTEAPEKPPLFVVFRARKTPGSLLGVED